MVNVCPIYVIFTADEVFKTVHPWLPWEVTVYNISAPLTEIWQKRYAP